MIPFSQFLTEVKALAFPQREATRLQTLNRNHVEVALIKLQTYIRCLRNNQINTIPESDMTQTCRVGVANQEKGLMQAVYAFKPGFACKRYFYEFVQPSEIACWMRSQGTCNRIEEGGWQNTEESQTDACTTMEDNYEDFWKCSQKQFSLNGNKIQFAPAPPCGYLIAVHWQGIKRNWADADLIPDDQDLKNAVALWVEYQDALRANCDARVAQDRLQAFNDASQDIWYRCRREAYVTDLDTCMGDVATYWDVTYVEDGDATDATTSSSSTTSSTTTDEGEVTTTTDEGDVTTSTDEAEFTTNPVSFCITEFECLGTSGFAEEGDVVGEFGEFDFGGARANSFTTGMEECDYKFRFVLDCGSGVRLDKIEIRIVEADGTETNQRWSTDSPATYPLALYASPLDIPASQVVADYVTAPFSNANSLGTYTGEVEFFAYGQIYIPANQTTSQHFRITVVGSEDAADPGEDLISNTIVAFELASCTSECEAPNSVNIGWDPDCDTCGEDAVMPQYTVGQVGHPGTIGGPFFGNCDSRVFGSFEARQSGCVFEPAPFPTLFCCGYEYVIFDNGTPPAQWEPFTFTAQRGTFIGFCPSGDGFVLRVVDPGELCVADAATQDPVESGNLPAAPQCANTGPYIDSAEWECVAGGWELVSVNLVAGTLVNLVPAIGTLFPENQDAILLAEIELNGQSFQDTITYFLAECASATTPEGSGGIFDPEGVSYVNGMEVDINLPDLPAGATHFRVTRSAESIGGSFLVIEYFDFEIDGGPYSVTLNDYAETTPPTIGNPQRLDLNFSDGVPGAPGSVGVGPVYFSELYT